MPARMFVGARTLAPFLEPFAAALTAAGYGATAICELLRGVRHLDDWISAQGLAVDGGIRVTQNRKSEVDIGISCVVHFIASTHIRDREE